MRRPEKVVLAHDPYNDPKDGAAMEFRLTYEGILLGASRSDTRAQHKHEIRKVFHKQLKRLWQIHPAYESYRYESLTGGPEQWAKGNYDQVVANFERFGYRFFPLATEYASLLCSVQILFLRPDVPGDVIRSGDIDNRLKTIFDALRLPGNKGEVAGYPPAKDEDPFFCLLEDDRLINHASVEADTLLEPTGPDRGVNDARLVITVRLKPYRVTMQNLGFS